MSAQPPPPWVPNGPLTPGAQPDHPDSRPVPPTGPVYGPAPQRYGAPPAPTYGQVPPAAWAPGPAPIPAGPPVLRPDYASWGRRVAAWLIDFLPMYVALIPLTVAYLRFVLELVRTPASRSDRLPDLSGLVAWLVVGGVLYVLALAWDVYNRWLVGGRTGRSLGKRVMKLRLIGEPSGQPIGALNAFARDLVHYLDGLAYVGFLWPLWDDKRQTFADMLMHTIVIDERGGSTGDTTMQVRA